MLRLTVRRCLPSFTHSFHSAGVRFQSESVVDSSASAPIRPESSAPHGTVLKGISFIKGQADPVAKADNEYPEWLWALLDPKPKNEDIFSRPYQRKLNKDAIKAKNFLKKR